MTIEETLDGLKVRMTRIEVLVWSVVATGAIKIAGAAIPVVSALLK